MSTDMTAAAPGRTTRQAGSLSVVEGITRQYDYWATVYRRTWRGGVVSSFATPLFYVVAMGILLGGFIDGDPDQLEEPPPTSPSSCRGWWRRTR